MLRPLHQEGGSIFDMRCGLCRSTKHSIQYDALRIYHDKKDRAHFEERPGACLVCPRCDCLDSLVGA